MKMEKHTTTTARSRPQATPRARPLGGRKFTDRHATADWCARRFKPKPDFDRFEAVQILEEIGTHLPQDRRMTPQLIAHLRLLVRMTRPRNWHDGMPVVWMSVKKTAELLGITPAQVNRNENRLMAMRLITFRDSANHKRFGTRCQESERITGANGIDLSPLGTQLTYLRGMREAILETRHRKAAYRQLITRLRRRIRGIFAGMNDGSWTGPVPRGPLTRWPASSRRFLPASAPAARCRSRSLRGMSAPFRGSAPALRQAIARRWTPRKYTKMTEICGPGIMRMRPQGRIDAMHIQYSDHL